MDTEVVYVYTYRNTIQPLKEKNNVIFSIMDATGDYHAKSNSKRKTNTMSILQWDLNYCTNEHI